MNITQVEPETLEALNEQVAELDRPVTEVPWWEFDSDDSHQQDRVSFIEQFPNGKGAEPVVTDDGVNQSGFANFWEIGPELPPQPKTPNIRIRRAGRSWQGDQQEPATIGKIFQFDRNAQGD